MRKAVDVYALGMLIYEVWPSILDLQGKKLSPDAGPIRERPFYKVPIHSIMLKVSCGGATATTFVDGDSDPYLGNVARMLE